jgi:phospholipid/cholesterol/gamma-HCH transport system substrate-binding protein
MRREMKLGIFFTGALLILIVFIFVVGNLSNLFRRPGYPIIVRYDTSLGLDKTAAVKMAGIKIGYVKDIQLDVRRSKVILSIYPRYKIPVGSKAVQAVQGLLGEKYVEIQPSLENTFCQPGDELVPGPAAGLDQLTPMLTSLGNDFQQVAKDLQAMMNPEVRENLNRAVKNISALSAGLQDFVAANRAKLDQTISSASQTAQTLDREVRTMSESFDATLTELRQILQENRGDIRDNLGKLRQVLDKVEESVKLLNASLDKIQKGEGSVGKLVNDEGLYDEAKGAVRDVGRIANSVSAVEFHGDIRGEYLAESQFFKPALTLGVWHRKKLFVLGQFVNQPAKGEGETGDRFTYSLQGGYRWGGLAPRAGIIESEFGAGIDYYALKDRLVLSVEGLNFNRAVSPLFRTFARFYPQKNVYLILGLEDFTLAAKREVFFGLGLGL